jgi:hypothetical protein
MWLFPGASGHRRDWWAPFGIFHNRTRTDERQHSVNKRKERDERISGLSEHYTGAYSGKEQTILSKNVQTLVQEVHGKQTTPLEILRAYGKAALKAHEKTNCITEVMIAKSESWLVDECNLDGIFTFPL